MVCAWRAPASPLVALAHSPLLVHVLGHVQPLRRQTIPQPCSTLALRWHWFPVMPLLPTTLPAATPVLEIWYVRSASAACVFAYLGSPRHIATTQAHGLEFVVKAAQWGFSESSHAADDSDLVGLRGQPKFEEALKRMALNNEVQEAGM